jgi:hypothetical protein
MYASTRQRLRVTPKPLRKSNEGSMRGIVSDPGPQGQRPGGSPTPALGKSTAQRASTLTAGYGGPIVESTARLVR